MREKFPVRAALIALAVGSSGAVCQTYPAKPVRLVVAASTGGKGGKAVV